MSIRVYNTLTRQKEAFEPVTAGKAGIYLCGPTVYKPSHIGHAVGPIIFDAIVRYLKFRGYEVRWIVNITDVDDKIIAEAARQDREMIDIAREVEADYKDCMEKLGVRNITDWPRATEHIDDIIELVRRLVEKGAGYVVDGDVYFDHTAAKDYGKLSGRRTDEALAGTRDLEGKEKRHPADFALWKASKEGEPAWDSPWGPGRPGWHIECSAMSINMLGETFDIHGGGLDLIFPHHENEIAQSEAATGKPFAKYWMHNGLTRIKTKAGGSERTEKMSKSLGNIRTISSLLEDYTGETIRAFVLSTHYRRPLDFSDEQLQATAKSLERFYRLFQDAQSLGGGDPYDSNCQNINDVAAPTSSKNQEFVRWVQGAEERFFKCMDNDFNTAGAIAALHRIASAASQFREEARRGHNETRQLLSAAAGTVVRLGSRILGLFEQKAQPTAKVDEQNIQSLVADREAARGAKDFARADEIRVELADMGITLEDTSAGTIWRKS